MVSSSEIEELIVQLHKEGQNIREISKNNRVHKNFTYIGAVLKKRFPEEYPKEDNSKKTSQETQAIILFSKGKDLVYVATNLDMKPEDVKRLYLEYLDLKGLYDLTKFYHEQPGQFLSFVQFYNDIKSKGISTLKVIGLAELVDKIPGVEVQFKEKSESIQGMLQQEQSIAQEINRLENTVITFQKYISTLNFEYENKRNEIQNLNYEIDTLKKQIEEIKRKPEYQNMLFKNSRMLDKLYQDGLRALSQFNSKANSAQFPQTYELNFMPLKKRKNQSS